MKESRRKGQAIVEFGVVALLFTALMFAVVDFGLVLNSWLSVSSGAREIARNASVGKKSDFLTAEAKNLTVLSVSSSGFSGFCCSSSSAVEVKVDYFPRGCPPWQGGCSAWSRSDIDPNYPFGSLGLTGSCAAALCHPQPDDLVKVTVIAHGAQVITPLIRVAVGCTNGSNPNCYFPVQSETIARYEGQEF